MRAQSNGNGVKVRGGFTLIELILVVAVVAILAAILVPTVFSILDDSAITKGKADVKAIAGALVKFRDDTGVFPTRDADVLNGEVNLLYSGTVAPLIAAFSPSPGAAFDCTTAANCDTFQFPFITNAGTNAYSTSGKKFWRGPYLSENATDEFDTPYIVYVRRLRLAGGVTTERSWVVFAGPNKQYNTTPGSTSAQGDDFVFLIR
ncbi:MAG TPA: prepilin-type N-terminal cleavage/methylation domain-containing protein [Candidatus Methylomirabilis sp.]|nr:prepilin-type N-terminal cleavage/methylation domain-containing protein [Candidatus Methylomirabilis sp.]